MSSEVVKDLLKKAESLKEFRKENDDLSKMIASSTPVTNRRRMGAPRAVETPEEALELINEYFEDCDGRYLTNKEGEPVLNKFGEPVIVGARPLTVAGLCLALGLTSREGLDGYLKRPEFADLIRRAKLAIEAFTNEACFDKNASQGARFVLSAVHGYKTEKEVNHTGSVEVKHSATKNLSDDQKLQLIDRAKKSLQSKQEIVEVLDSELSDPIKNETDQESPDWAK